MGMREERQCHRPLPREAEHAYRAAPHSALVVFIGKVKQKPDSLSSNPSFAVKLAQGTLGKIFNLSVPLFSHL